MKVALASASPLLASLLWTAALVLEPGPLDPWAVFLVGLGLLGSSTVAVIGVAVVGGRWAWRTGLAVIGYTLLLAVVRPIDALWLAALAVSLLAGVCYQLPVVTRGVRRLPAATGPPARAVTLPLLLVAVPGILGLAAWDGPTTATLLVATTAPLAALWYARVLPGGLFAVRIAWPLLALALAAFQTLIATAATAALALLALVIAWHPEVKVAFHPPREPGTVFPIPPELAPPEILDAARLDDRGRPT